MMDYKVDLFAPIPYRNNVIQLIETRYTYTIHAPIPYRNNVIIKKSAYYVKEKSIAPIPYRNNVINSRRPKN